MKGGDKVGVILFKLDSQDVVVNNNDYDNVKKYFMQTTELIKSESITDCLRTNILRSVGIMEA